MRLTGFEYKWIALSNTTLGMLMATINASILLIALPDIFRGIRLDPLQPANTSYLLWLILGFLVVSAVLVVSLGRLGDMFGRVKVFNLGFVVFTVFSILLSVTWLEGSAGALWLIGMRIGQGVGGAMLFANSSAILTDAFPKDERGLALGVNSIAAIAGSFLGLVLGGLLGPVSWRLVFLVSVPFGLFGTAWAYHNLRELGVRKAARIDWWGNLSFALGLVGLMVGITYGIQPYGGHTMGWTAPLVLATLSGGLVMLVVFCLVELRVPEPMFHLQLFRVRAFAAGNLAALLSAIGRGGLQFILIIWLQGIWLPEHGYDFAQTPLWAGIYMLPLIAGFLVAGPVSGYLSDRFGARPFATGGMLVAALSFLLLILLPVDFAYPWFALILLLNGIGMGLFAAPNSAAVMNSLPPGQRGAGAGMLATFQNSASVLSIGVFFTLMIVGLAAGLPHSLQSGLVAHGVSNADATRVSHLPPVASLFAAFLGYNPVQTLLGPHVLTTLPAGQAQQLTGRAFFPQLITGPFHSALVYAFVFAIVACLVAAFASLLRGGKYHYQEGAVALESGSALGIEPVALLEAPDNEQATGVIAAHSDGSGKPTSLAGRHRWDAGSTDRPTTDNGEAGRPGKLIRLAELRDLSPEERAALAVAEQARAALRTRFQASDDDGERAQLIEKALLHVDGQLAILHRHGKARSRLAAELETTRQRLRTQLAQLHGVA